MEKVLEYIKMLSEKDTKTLSEKALKTVEEVGELASVVLPFDNADGTKHRFVDKEAILEEAIDTVLTAISIPYSLGYSTEDIKYMMLRKANKWQAIQNKHSKIDGPIPYEIHITVDFVNLELEKEIGRFKNACEHLGVKPIVLDLENGEDTIKDIMTSSHFFGNNGGVIMEVQRIKDHLEKIGFKIIRSKIETVPWHPAAPQQGGEKMPGDCYFEAHIGCIITPEDKPGLVEIAKQQGAHISKNFFKKMEDGRYVNMITLRNYETFNSAFDAQVENLKRKLDQGGIYYEKVITEFAIYDTKVSHDFLWLSKLKPS
jgi:NTP pyrophosphatase (non-canonical NTP hydrolase)